MVHDLALMEYEEVYCIQTEMLIRVHDFLHLSL